MSSMHTENGREIKVPRWYDTIGTVPTYPVVGRIYNSDNKIFANINESLKETSAEKTNKIDVYESCLLHKCMLVFINRLS